MAKNSLISKTLGLLIVICICGFGFYEVFINNPSGDKLRSLEEWKSRPKKFAPADYFMMQRMYPYNELNVEAYHTAKAQALQMRANVPQTDEVLWEEAGPSNIGGRVTAIGVHPSIPRVVFIGTADGGVLRTTDSGLNWEPVFDDYGAMSIGAVTVDPDDPLTVWVGTGEANSAADNYPGDGIWKSSDGGESWEFKGLEDSYHINRVVIDPANSDRVFVAVMGAQWAPNPERGVYRTLNGGDDWERVHHLTDSTGCNDIVLHPNDPQIVYAAMWERIRHADARNVGGMTSGIWKSTNGGDDWTQLTNGLPPNADDVGRIGLTISPTDPDIMYALYCDHPGNTMGAWKTTNGGDSWFEVDYPGNNLYNGFGWYFGNIYVDPVDPDRVFALGVPLKVSLDGGGDWDTVTNGMHVDHHAFWINPNDTDHMYCGNDGGMYSTTNGGDDWTKLYDLHISQFYAIEIDYLRPQRLYGGTQDNGTLRTLTGELDDWEMIYGGDGFYTLVDHTDSDIIYAEYQWGGLGKSTDGGNDFDYALDGIDEDDRRNWSTPVVMDPVDPEVLYYGTFRIYKTTDGAGWWEAISEDLTDGPPTGYTYHTVTTISISPIITDIVYAGTDDGNVWVTTNGGGQWNRIDDGLPDRWVTRVHASPSGMGTAYVTLSGYRWNEYQPHVFMTTDYGQNWDDISGNLPEVPVNVIIEDPEYPDRLFIGTDFGTFYTENLGGEWYPLGTEIPLCSVNDMKLHNPSRILVAGTHGRSMYKMELDSITVNVEPTVGDLQPDKFTVFEASPNPFNAQTKIRFRLENAGDIKLAVYDVQGREVVNLWDGYKESGEYNIIWNAEGLSSGTYFARLDRGGKSHTVKLVLVK